LFLIPPKLLQKLRIRRFVAQEIDSPKLTEYTPLGLPNFTFKSALFRFNAGFLSARIGEWLFTVALNWAIFVQTESPLLLAVINACRLLPNLFLSVPAGVLADRFDRRKLNVLNSVFNAILTAAVGAVLLLGLPFWCCALLVVFRAIVTASEGPWRNALLCNVFAGDRLKSVVAQNASVMNLGRIIGPVLAGATLAAWGGFPTFLLAALVTLFYSVALQTMPGEDIGVAKRSKPTENLSLKATLAEYPDLKKLLLLAIPVMFFGFPFTAMLPMITEEMLKLGSQEFGTLLAISAAGALVASMRLSAKPGISTWANTRNYALLFGLSLLGLSLASGFYSAALVLFIVGYFGQAYRSCSRMLYQEIVPREKAGRLLGIALMDRGIIPLGGLLVGAVAERFAPGAGVVMMGAGCFLSVLLFFPLRGFKRPLSAVGLVGLMVTVALVLSGCQNTVSENATASGPTVSVEHAWGTTDVPLKPKNIVVLDLPFLDAMTALGQPVAGFAGTSDKNIPAYLVGQLPVGSAPTFVGERKQPNLEVILSLKPDLIVANPDRHKMIRQQLESLAPTIALTDDSLDQVREVTRTFAAITERKAELEQVEGDLQESLAKAKDQQDGTPGVLVVGAFEDEFSTWTAESFIGSLFAEIGANYLFKGPPSASESQTEVAKITVESLAQLNPDLLFVYGDASRWDANPIFRKLSAYQESKILPIDRDLWSRARGPLAAQKILQAYVEFLNNQVAATHEAP
jgi:MFS transporter, DHA1 family, staphyloferrin A biosynthesis exporter